MGRLNSSPVFTYVVAQGADNVLPNAEGKLGSKVRSRSSEIWGYYPLIEQYLYIYRISEYLSIVPWQY